jgi:glutamate-ammonia-ligase adenylyltransferase
VPATRTARGRELLTAILPRLLEDMGKTGEADEAFRWFSRFFSGLSSGVQTLAMLLAEPDLLDDLVATLALAPRLAEILSRRPDLLESLVSGQAPVRPELGPDTSFDTALDAWRRYHRDQHFLTGHRLLHGLIPARDAAEYWTALADDTITEMAAAAKWETERRNGPQPGEWAVFAMGKLGGKELTAGSDLDILVIYDADPMEAQTWYTRFTQRLITALSAPTAEGALYEVDMRLRPSGRAGPVAVSLPAFTSYQNKDAWTWEHMALTRLRPVTGDTALGSKVMEIAIDAITSRAQANAASIPADITDMRQRLYREKPGKGLWDLKTAEGGLIDVEFMVQQDMLLSGRPDAIWASTRDAIAYASFNVEERLVLNEGLGLLQALQQVQRIAIGTETRSDAMPAGLRDRLCRAVEADTFRDLEIELSSTKSRLHQMAVEKLHLDATES